MAVLYTPHFMQFFDNNGDPLAGGLLYTYEAGTTTPKATYTTTDESVPLANPIVLDSSGRATLFIKGSYKFRLETSLGVLVRETDNISSFDTANASSGVINWATADTLASASSVAIGAAQSNYIIITGTTTITSFDTIAQGAERLLRFNAALTLTHNAASLILPGGLNITVAAGDVIRFISEGVGNWRMISRSFGVVTEAASIALNDNDTTIPSSAAVKDYVDKNAAINTGVVQATTSGTAKTFTGFPANTKVIHLLLSGVSTNGAARLLLTLGDAGGLETTGYQNTTARDGGSTSSVTSGFTLTESTAAADTYNGIATLRLIDASTFTWVLSSSISSSTTGPFVHVSAGNKSLSDVLTQISFTTEGGANTLDLGKVNIQYEIGG